MRLLGLALSSSCSSSRGKRAFRVQCGEFLGYVLVMSCGPVDPVAAWTPYKARLCGKNVRRHALRHLCLGDGKHWLVTPGTAREGVGQRIDLKGGNHLSELGAEVIAFNEEQWYGCRVAQQTAVAGQERTSLGARMMHQRLPAEVCSVRGILSDDAQPRSQAAKHLVDREAIDHGTTATPGLE